LSGQKVGRGVPQNEKDRVDFVWGAPAGRGQEAGGVVKGLRKEKKGAVKQFEVSDKKPEV